MKTLKNITMLIILISVSNHAFSQVVSEYKLNLLEEKNEPVEVPIELLSKYVGTYLMDDGFSAIVTKKDSQLMIAVDGQPKDHLYAVSEEIFKVTEFDAEARFKIDSVTQKTRITLSKGFSIFYGIKQDD